MGFFLHPLSIPMVRKSNQPERGIKNVFYGYVLVFLTYTFIGVTGYIGFSGTFFTNSF